MLVWATTVSCMNVCHDLLAVFLDLTLPAWHLVHAVASTNQTMLFSCLKHFEDFTLHLNKSQASLEEIPVLWPLLPFQFPLILRLPLLTLHQISGLSLFLDQGVFFLWVFALAEPSLEHS